MSAAVQQGGPKGPLPGDVFNPYHKACGFHPPRFVGRLRLDGLTDGAKRAYQELVRRAGRDTLCFPSQATLADDLGMTERAVRKHIAVLVKLGFIRHQRSGRKSNRYEFLWHSCFDRHAHAAQEHPSTVTPMPLEDEEPEFQRHESDVRPAQLGHSTVTPMPLNIGKESLQENLGSATEHSSTLGERPPDPSPKEAKPEPKPIPKPIAVPCNACKGTALVGHGDEVRFCTCPAGRKLREREPDAVQQLRDLAKRLAPKAKALLASAGPTPPPKQFFDDRASRVIPIAHCA